MDESKPCPYCDAPIRAGKRGPRLDQRKTCGARECRRRHHNALNATWRAENRDHHRALIRAWRLANAQRVRVVNRAWWNANRSEQYEINRLWREANREHHKDLIRDWERRNPAARLGYSARRRAWVSAGSVSTRDWLRLLNRCGGRCFYCGSAGPLTVDHVVPLSRGGQHAIGNVVPACRSCNSSKQDRLLIQWKAGRHAVERPGRARLVPNPRVRSSPVD